MATSKDQFRALFEKHEPELMKLCEQMVNSLGRENVKRVLIYCPVAVRTPVRVTRSNNP